MPKISVIVPVYKVEQYLDRCVESIVAQTFRDFELILVDDGSPDNCPAMCDGWVKKDNRIRVIHQENGGLSAARNAGIDWVFENSDSEWLTFIDSDDWVHKKYLEYLYNAAIKHNVLVAIGGIERTSGADPLVKEEDAVGKIWNTEKYFVEYISNGISSCGKLINKDCFELIRFPVGRIHEDDFTTYKFLFMREIVSFAPAPLYAYYENSDSITSAKWSSKRIDALDARKERIEYFRERSNDHMYQWSLETYIWYIIGMRKKVLELNNESTDKYSKVLLDRLRKELKYYKKDTPISKFAGAYELAFPIRTKAYWICQSLKNKVKKLFRKG